MPRHPQKVAGVGKSPGDIHSFKYIRQNVHSRPGKMEEAAAGEEIVWSLSPEARPVVPRPGWWEGRCVARPTANRGARPPSRSRVPRPFTLASAATGTESPRPGRSQATVGGLRRAVSPPPARPQGRGRCQGDRTCSVRGLGPFRGPVHLRCLDLPITLSGQEQRGRGAAGGPPTHLRARAATPGGQRHPEPPQPLLLPPPEAPLRKRDHWSEAATIPDMVPPSAPPTSPFPHAGLPSRSYWGAEVHFPRSDAY